MSISLQWKKLLKYTLPSNIQTPNNVPSLEEKRKIFRPITIIKASVHTSCSVSERTLVRGLGSLSLDT